MPTPTTYTYTISTDFPGGKVNTEKLDKAIRASSIATALDGINTNGDVLDIVFKDALSMADQTTLDGGAGTPYNTHPAAGLIASTDNSPSQPISAMQIADMNGNILNISTDDGSGALKVASNKPTGTKVNFYSHNFCDPCTWYQQSTKVTAQTLTDSGDGKTFNGSGHTNWIDMKHGRVSNEDNIVAHNSNNWIVTVTANGVAQTEDTDYTVNYEAGTVTFGSAPTTPIVATYWYAGSSKFTLAPSAGMTWDLEFVEIQFSKNLALNDTFVYTGYGYAGVFAPAYVPSIFQATDLVQLGDALIYKNAMDFINDSDVVYPVTPAFGGTQGPAGGGRAITQDVITFAWSYATKTELVGNAGMQMVVKLKNDIPCSGEMSVATFYMIAS